MPEIFISPILLTYNYLEDLLSEAILVLELESINQSLKNKLKTSLFINFNRYLMIEVAMIPESIQKGFLESLQELMEEENELKTIKLLTDLEILPETKKEFLKILKSIKNSN